ncbi:MAG TPA: hypothetical protein PLZ61_06955, partial [Candidatus Cryosericum sp.]|nr:hypothetical protein [Candidatus Cryosericum sp.]
MRRIKYEGLRGGAKQEVRSSETAQCLSYLLKEFPILRWICLHLIENNDRPGKVCESAGHTVVAGEDGFKQLDKGGDNDLRFPSFHQELLLVACANAGILIIYFVGCLAQVRVFKEDIRGRFLTFDCQCFLEHIIVLVNDGDERERIDNAWGSLAFSGKLFAES